MVIAISVAWVIVCPQVIDGGASYFFIFGCLHLASPLTCGLFAFMMYYGEINIQRKSDKEQSGRNRSDSMSPGTPRLSVRGEVRSVNDDTGAPSASRRSFEM
jgi:hypothetical protein